VKGTRRTRARRRFPTAVAGVVGVAMIALAAALLLRPRAVTRPFAEYDEALRLSTSGAHVASLRHYARAAHDMARVWVFHFNYSSALYNAALEVNTRFESPAPRTRSSVERIRLLDRSLEEITAAESLVLDTGDRATVLLARAQMMQIWGLGWDAMGPLERAHRLDASVEHGMAAAQFALMEHPEIPDSASR
jgi:hypothetical protein